MKSIIVKAHNAKETGVKVGDGYFRNDGGIIVVVSKIDHSKTHSPYTVTIVYVQPNYAKRVLSCGASFETDLKAFSLFNGSVLLQF